LESLVTATARPSAIRSVLHAALFVLELLIVAAACVGLSAVALVFPAVNPAATPVWPPTGLALALILLRDYRIWPGIVIGYFCSRALTDQSYLDAAVLALGVTVAGLAGAWLTRRWSNGRKTFATPLGVAKFSLICFAPTALIASLAAVAATFVSRNVTVAEAVATWSRWWSADAAGSLLIAPVVILWATTPLLPLSRRHLEALVLFIAVAVIGAAAFVPASTFARGAEIPHVNLLGFLALVPLMWAGLNARPRDAATAALLFVGIAGWGLSLGADSDSRLSLLLLFILSVVTTVPPLILAATIAMRWSEEARLVAGQGQLRRKIEETNAALHSARRHFQTLIEGVVDYAIFVVDPAGRVASWNSAAQKIMGYSADEIVGKHFGMFYRPDERRAGEPNRALELAIQHGKHETEGWRIKKNGALFFVTGSISSMRNDDGNLMGFFNVIRDTTERRDAQEKLVQAREQLAMAQKMEAIGKLTGGIAHDFNNLLMIIGGNAQTFKRLLDPRLPRAIEAIQTAAKRGESLTRQLLTFSRRQHLSPTVVDLSTSIRNMRTMVESSLRGNIVYEERIEQGVLPVKVDLAELELAIVNIAVNARDAMPNGGTFTLSVRSVPAEELHGDNVGESFVAIELRDTGMGMPPNLLSKIFDPFFTTKEVGKGTGLGLSQVYGFAHQAGGTVRAESKVEQGTLFTVYLPLCAEKPTVGKDLPSIDLAHSQRPTVLVVDDSAEVAQVTSSLFEHLGFHTVYRDSAEAALKVLAGGARFDLVFSDIVMPGTIDGVGLAREIRSRYPHLPVALTTGYSDAAQAAPPDLPILRKPFDSDALRGFIQDAVDVNATA
jgi:PAS domain S-box-containing protein